MSIQPGKYRARAQADSVQFGVSRNGNEQIAITFDLLLDDDTLSGETITWIGFFSDKTMTRTMESVENCGWNMKDGPTHAERVGDNVVELVIESEEWEGKAFLKVKWINRLGARFAFDKPLEQSQKGSLFARIKAHAGASPGAVPAAQPRRPTPRPAPQRPAVNGDGTDVDDIPF